MSRKIKKIRGEHGLNFFISYQLKKRLINLAQRYDTSLAEIVRTLLKLGIPVLEGYQKAQEETGKEVAKLISSKISESKDPKPISPPPSPTGESARGGSLRGEV